MRLIVAFALSLGIIYTGTAQNSIEEVLAHIAANNKEIKAGEQFTRSQKLEATVGNTLPDPTVNYEHLWGKPASMGTDRELTVTQEFDFPTVYVNRHKLTQSKSALYDRQEQEERQAVLLDAKLVCLDMIGLNKLLEYQETRLRHTRQLSEIYKQRVNSGDANILESNKIDMEILGFAAQVRKTRQQLEARKKELQRLNGGIPITLTQKEYAPVILPADFQSWKSEALAADATLIALQKELDISRKEIRLNRSEWFPKFELGYKRTAGGELFNGIVVGVSIPLYENRNKIKWARATSLHAEMQLENARLSNETELENLYDEAVGIEKSKQEYHSFLQSQNTLELLEKALDNGHISILEFFADANLIYRIMEEYIELENEYQKRVAQLYKYQL